MQNDEKNVTSNFFHLDSILLSYLFQCLASIKFQCHVFMNVVICQRREKIANKQKWTSILGHLKMKSDNKTIEAESELKTMRNFTSFRWWMCFQSENWFYIHSFRRSEFARLQHGWYDTWQLDCWTDRYPLAKPLPEIKL